MHCKYKLVVLVERELGGPGASDRVAHLQRCLGLCRPTAWGVGVHTLTLAPPPRLVRQRIFINRMADITIPCIPR